jgi:mono/diheme cytochrome c family protein
MKTLTCILLMSAGAYAASPLEHVPAKAAAKKNPLEDQPRARQAGEKLFSRECAACHGSNAQGGRTAPPLRQPEVYGAPPGSIFWVLRNGSLNRGMPSFAHLPEPQRWQIVTYLKSLVP